MAKIRVAAAGGLHAGNAMKKPRSPKPVKLPKVKPPAIPKGNQSAPMRVAEKVVTQAKAGGAV
jgi:hypothetical protein